MKIGECIAAYRESTGISVRDLAKEIQISPATLNRIERGNRCESDVMTAILFWMIKDHFPKNKK